jgi:Xaa-Pro aminopeptidase
MNYPQRVDHLFRIGQLRRRITRAGLSGLVVTHLPDVRYLCGFTGSSAALGVTRRAARLCTDGRYAAQAAEEVKGAQVQIGTGSAAVAAVEWLAAQPGAEVAGFDPAWTSVADLSRLKAALPSPMRRGFLSALAAPLVERLRQVKDAEELALMGEAALLGCRLFEHILGFIRPGLMEVEVAAELEHKARLLGAEGMSFETIVASGVRSALPHGRATTTRLPRKGFVTLDFGIILGGYCSDMTRTVYLESRRRASGRPTRRCLRPRKQECRRCTRGQAARKWTRRRAGCCARWAWRRRFRIPPGTEWGWRFTNRRALGLDKRPGCLPEWW